MSGDSTPAARHQAPQLIVLGTSLGGVRALEVVLAHLGADYSVPLAIVLHRHDHSGEVLLRQLQRCTALKVSEPNDKDPIEAGIHLAPAGYHLIVERGWFSLSLDAPVRHARPSIDVLFETAADAYGPALLGVVLTGASDDGAGGSAQVRARGGTVVIEDPRTAEARQMPAAALAAGPAKVLALADIGPFLAAL